jgi:hypothetical protein
VLAGWGHHAWETGGATRGKEAHTPASLGRTHSPGPGENAGMDKFCLGFILAIGSIIDGGFGWRRYVVPCKSYDTGSVVVWTSLGPLLRWVPGPTTGWAPGTTQLGLYDTY